MNIGPASADAWHRFSQRAMACSLQGVLYGSPATPEAPATILWRPFDNPQSQQWSLALPDGEEAAAVAAGRQFSAAAMSTRMLRIFAESGTLFICLDLPLWLCLHGHGTDSQRGGVLLTYGWASRRLWYHQRNLHHGH